MDPSIERGGRLRRALGRGAAFILAATIPKALQLVTLPLYTRAMSAEEFGRLALVVALTTAVVPLLTRGIDTATFRGWFELAGEPEEQRRFVSTAGVLMLILPLALAAVVAVASLPYTLQSDSLPTSYLLLGLAGFALTLTVSSVPLAVLRAQERIRMFIVVSVAPYAVAVPLTVVAVVFLHLGARGWLGANLIAAVSCLPVCLYALRDNRTRALSRRHARWLMRWSIPLVPHGASQWALATSDRFILERYVTLANLGIYNIGYQISTVMGLLLTAMNNVVQPEYGKAINDKTFRARLPLIATYQVFAILGIAGALALLGPPAIELLLPPAFHGAGDVVTWVALGYAFYGFYLVAMNRVVILGGDVALVWAPTMVAAALSIGLNLLLVPDGGIIAAAVVTAIAYFALFVGVAIYALLRHRDRDAYDWTKIAAACALAATLYAAAAVTTPAGALAAFAAHAGWLALYTAITVVWLKPSTLNRLRRQGKRV